MGFVILKNITESTGVLRYVNRIDGKRENFFAEVCTGLVFFVSILFAGLLISRYKYIQLFSHFAERVTIDNDICFIL